LFNLEFDRAPIPSYSDFVTFKLKSAHGFGMVLAATYFVTACAGYALHKSGVPYFFWLPSGVAFGGLAIGGLRAWPWVALPSFLFCLLRGFPLVSCPIVTLGNVVGPSVAVYLLTQVTGSPPSLKSVVSVLLYVGVFLATGFLIGSGIETFGLWIGGFLDESQFFPVWRDAWLDEALGCLIIGTLALVVGNDRKSLRSWPRRWRTELASVLVLALLVSALCYSPLISYNPSVLIRPYLLYPFIIWASLRFGMLGSLLVLMVVFATVAVGLSFNTLPLWVNTKSEQVLVLRCILIVFGIVGLVIAAALREKDEALQAREEFLSIATHELKTPITTLTLRAQQRNRNASRGGLTALAPEKVSEFFLSDERQLQRLSRLVDDMLDISRLRQKRLNVTKQLTDLCELAGDVVSRLRLQFESSGSAIHFQKWGKIMCMCDPYRIEQAITNLLTNATKYGNRNPILVKIERQGLMAKISFRDQGIGIRKEDQKRIFHRFERAVSAREASGLGLGLYITQEIVKAHGGTMSVQSRPGKGSTFNILIPIETCTAASENHAKEQ
jgi:signal transduction histidine kinase